MILVTGGAGFIGSHTLHLLTDRGISAIALDNLSTGHRWAIPKKVEFVEGNVGDTNLLEKILVDYQVSSVLHFAGSLSVIESMNNPLKYFDNNFEQSKNLILTCMKVGVSRFVFSSSCSVYGSPERILVDETCPTEPISTYGRSKLMTEWFLEDLAKLDSTRMRYVILRYFNVAGAKATGGLGPATVNSTQLVKSAAEVACGKRAFLTVYGTDYPTSDGTCIRDYIHVDDLANVHLLAVEYLKRSGKSTTLNVGYGKGYSVKEVIQTMKSVSNVDFPVTYANRRLGDSVAVFSDSKKARDLLGWKPKYDDLALICKTSYDWERQFRA